MKNGIIIAGFFIVLLVLYLVWGNLNSKLIAIESSTGSYLYDEEAPIGPDIDDIDRIGDTDLSPLLDRLASLETRLAESAERIEVLQQRVALLEARDTGRGGKVTHREIVFFEFNDDSLSREATDKIDSLLQRIEGKAFVSLIGHADTSGDNRYNHLLSLRRAAVVKRYIQSRLQANNEPDKLLMSTTGTGEESVINTTGDDIRERNNRIVEILVFE